MAFYSLAWGGGSTRRRTITAPSLCRVRTLSITRHKISSILLIRSLGRVACPTVGSDNELTRVRVHLTLSFSPRLSPFRRPLIRVQTDKRRRRCKADRAGERNSDTNAAHIEPAHRRRNPVIDDPNHPPRASFIERRLSIPPSV